MVCCQISEHQLIYDLGHSVDWPHDGKGEISIGSEGEMRKEMRIHGFLSKIRMSRRKL